jgi:hypothetical protein
VYVRGVLDHHLLPSPRHQDLLTGIAMAQFVTLLGVSRKVAPW